MGRDDIPEAIKFVGDNSVKINYRIYVDEHISYKKAYYLLFDNNKLTIRRFGWDIFLKLSVLSNDQNNRK